MKKKLFISMLIMATVACGETNKNKILKSLPPVTPAPTVAQLTPLEAAQVENLNLKLQMLQQLYTTVSANIAANHPGYYLQGNQLVQVPKAPTPTKK